MIPDQLDSVNVPLSGFNLIEAAAGTGKTYNIQNLVARMILEKSITIDEIAVLSFTNEAAAELAKRIRNILETMLAVLEGIPVSNTEQAVQIIARDRDVRNVSNDERIAAVRNALLDFDLANISTINGFCQKLIQRFAFESRSVFNAVLESSSDKHIQNILDDWMRGKFYQSETSAVFAALISQREVYRLKRHVLDFNLLIPESRKRYDELFVALIDLFNAFCPEETFEVFSTGVFRSNASVFTKVHIFERALLEKDWEIIFQMVDLYQYDNVLRGVLKKHVENVSGLIRRNEFFDICHRVSELKKGAIADLKSEAIYFARQRFAELAQRGNFMTFADQIRIVDEALEKSPEFKNIIRSKLKAGIIDEFQDTDAMQYRIFKALFHGDDHCVFLVGDPRQAIYRFRGGDINTYLIARNEAAQNGHVYRLGVNYRSSVKMVEAVNRIFAVHPHPFGSADISFPELAARPAGEAPELLEGDGSAPEALLRIIPDAAGHEFMNWCALRIVKLLSPASTVKLPDGSALKPGDIAVLLHTNRECIEMRRELERLNIPATCMKSGNIFAGNEATELYMVMDAVLNPDDHGRMHTALATRLCNIPLNELHVGKASSELITGCRELFKQLNQIWLNHGFAAMFELFLREFHVRENLADKDNGERCLTNLFQLEDLVQHESLVEHRSPEGILAWLGNMIAVSNEPGEHREEHEELMATDGSMVRVMTIHASKGLQFPIVMLPGIQKLSVNGRNLSGVFYNGSERELDLENNPENSELEMAEIYDEYCRLIYVAVTRAEYRCEILETPTPVNDNSVWDALMAYSDLPRHQFGCMDVQSYNSNVPELIDDVPEFPEKFPAWQVISYSSLVDGVTAVPQDHDEVEDIFHGENQAILLTDRFSPFALSGGTGFGNLIHECFEKISFDASPGVFQTAAINIIRRSNQPPAGDSDTFVNEYSRWLRNIFHAPLVDADGEAFTLAQIPAKDRITEMEFCFGLGSFSAVDIQIALADYVNTEFGAVEYPEKWDEFFSGGILNGFIDLIFRRNGKFYILDWKTNRLDGVIENFSPEKLPLAMVHSIYFLQYILYTVALVRHLRRFCKGKFGEAEYDQMIGGVYYLFVRGVTPAVPGRGVFYSRPSWRVIQKMEEILCPESK